MSQDRHVTGQTCHRTGMSQDRLHMAVCQSRSAILYRLFFTKEENCSHIDVMLNDAIMPNPKPLGGGGLKLILEIKSTNLAVFFQCTFGRVRPRCRLTNSVCKISCDLLNVCLQRKSKHNCRFPNLQVQKLFVEEEHVPGILLDTLRENSFLEFQVWKANRVVHT